MKHEMTIRTYRPDDLPALVALINEADAFDQLERGTTLEEQGHEMGWPDYYPETDCFLAWNNGHLVGYADLLMGKGQANAESTFYTWGVVHPRWRRRGLGRHLLELLYRRATERLAEVEGGPVYFQGSALDTEQGRTALFAGFGMAPMRYFVNLARPINNGLPPLELPPGFRLRSFDPERDVEMVWQVDNLAFQDHWGFTGFPLEAFRHWLEMPHFRPELWLLVEEQDTGQVVGIGLNKVDPDWIARTGRQEGYVNTLAVLREYRKRGLGTALLVQSLHLLRQAGMEMAHLHADAENLTGAMRLYERVGFQVRKTHIDYRKPMNSEGRTAKSDLHPCDLTIHEAIKGDRR
jgi:mycothiol synthase